MVTRDSTFFVIIIILQVTATCTPEDEIIAGIKNAVQCAYPKVMAEYAAKSLEFFQDSCLDARTVGPCTLGVVNEQVNQQNPTISDKKNAKCFLQKTKGVPEQL